MFKNILRTFEAEILKIFKNIQLQQKIRRSYKKRVHILTVPLQNWPTEPLPKLPKDIMCYPSSHETEGCQPSLEHTKLAIMGF